MDLDKFTSNGKFLMLALDHRGSFKKLMNPEDPESVTDEQVIELKNKIIEALKDQFSALLIDEAWGLEACHEVCQVKPFLLPLEKTGYIDEDGERVTELEYSVKQIMDKGASGAKLLLYFNPDVASTKKQLETAKKVMDECKKADFPLFLEIVTYTPDVQLQFHIGSGVSGVRRFIEAGVAPDVWKLEYPGSEEAAREITNLVGNTPWILLTGGTDYETFKANLEGATRGGAKGFLAGRALWQEVCSLKGREKQKFLKEILPSRFKKVIEIATKF